MFELEAATAPRYVAQATRLRDLADVWAFENEAFGESNLDLETLRGWWWRYSRMALHVRDERGAIVGTFDASPLEAHAFESILEGRREERDLAADCVRALRRNEVAAHWCATSLVTSPTWAGRVDVLAALLIGIVHRLDSLPEISWPSAWCAVAQSPEGGRLLERAGFRRYRGGSSTKPPTYLLTLDSEAQLHAFVARLALAAEVYCRRARQIGVNRTDAARAV